jgi:hypothetical protein
MTPKQVKRRLATLMAKKEAIYAEVVKIQSKCSHEDLVGEHYSYPDNLWFSDDQRWVDFTCPTCKKRWTENLEETWYDTEAKVFRTKEGYAYTKVEPLELIHD